MSHKDSERYYWFKLKESLLTSEKVDFLMRQKGGANYVVLYQCICLKLVNNNGVFAVHLGDDIYVPYTEEKIAGETKGWFSLDTIKVALDLYRRLGLVFFQEDGLQGVSVLPRLARAVGDYGTLPACRTQTMRNHLGEGLCRI